MQERRPHLGPEGKTLDPDTSFNFQIAKVASILMVVLGHFLPGRGLWVPVTVGLFVFGFSSGFFTAARYRERFNLRKFWQKKLVRLGLNLLVINVFLLALFLIQGREGIWTWQTPVNWVGLTGFLNWFGVPNASPFGAGLWFFTLLLIFYTAYPALRLVSRSRRALGAFAFLTLVACAVLNELVPMGHMLWLTAWSFIFGVVVHRFNPSFPSRITGPLAIGLAAVMILMNSWLSLSHLNFLLIVAISAAAVLWVKEARLPRKPLSPLCLLSGCLLEIYFLHTYLFAHATGRVLLDLVISLALIISASLALSIVAGWTQGFTGRKPAYGRS